MSKKETKKVDVAPEVKAAKETVEIIAEKPKLKLSLLEYIILTKKKATKESLSIVKTKELLLLTK